MDCLPLRPRRFLYLLMTRGQPTFLDGYANSLSCPASETKMMQSKFESSPSGLQAIASQAWSRCSHHHPEPAHKVSRATTHEVPRHAGIGRSGCRGGPEPARLCKI